MANIRMVTTATVNSVSAGDVFIFLKDSGCRVAGELLVILDYCNSTSKNIQCAGTMKDGNCVTLGFLSRAITDGVLAYAGTTFKNNLTIKSDSDSYNQK